MLGHDMTKDIKVTLYILILTATVCNLICMELEKNYLHIL